MPDEEPTPDHEAVDEAVDADVPAKEPRPPVVIPKQTRLIIGVVVILVGLGLLFAGMPLLIVGIVLIAGGIVDIVVGQKQRY